MYRYFILLFIALLYPILGNGQNEHNTDVNTLIKSLKEGKLSCEYFENTLVKIDKNPEKSNYYLSIADTLSHYVDGAMAECYSEFMVNLYNSHFKGLFIYISLKSPSMLESLVSSISFYSDNADNKKEYINQIINFGNKQSQLLNTKEKQAYNLFKIRLNKL